MDTHAPGLRFGPVSPAAPGALYEQIVAGVKREVAAGRIGAGDPLPSVRALAADLLVSLITVKRAYEELQRDGIIYSRQGLGAFVADGGAHETRRQNTDAACTALRQAVKASRAAGLSPETLIDMLRSELSKETGHA